MRSEKAFFDAILSKIAAKTAFFSKKDAAKLF